MVFIRLFIFLFLVLMLCPSYQLYSQWMQAAKQLNKVNGLSDNHITALAQDSAGYIWIGTPNGLCRFDGFSIQTFTPSATSSISNEIINDIEADAAGNIWVATYRGLNRYDTKMQRWQLVVPEKPSMSDSLLNPLIWDVLPEKDGTLWIATDGAYFIQYHSESKRAAYFNFGNFVRKHPSFRQQQGYFAIQKCLRKSANEFWLAFNKGLAILNTSTGQFTLIGNGFDNNIVDMVWDEGLQKLWLSVAGGLLFSYNTMASVFRQESIIPFQTAASEMGEFSWVNHRCIVSDKGVVSLNATSSKQLVQPFAISDQNTLLQLEVSAILRTKVGTIFTGTNRGVWYFNSPENTASYLRLFEPNTELSSNSMTAIWEVDRLQLILATCANPAAFFVMSTHSGIVKKIDRDEQGNRLPACLMVKERGGVIWVLTAGKVFQYLPELDVLRPWKPALYLSAGYFRDIEMDDAGNWWLASFTGGVWRYNKVSRQWDQPGVVGSVAYKASTTQLVYDNRSRVMWAGYFGYGLQRYSFSSGRWERWGPDGASGLQETINLVNDMAADSAKNIWLATHAEGIFRFKTIGLGTSEWAIHNMRTGSLKNQYLSIAPARQGQLYALHASGLSLIDTLFKEKLVPIPFGGLNFGSDPLWPHKMYYNQRRQQLLIPASGGILRLNTNPAATPKFPLKVTALETEDTLINLHTSPTQNVELSYQHHFLQFRMEALYFGTTPLTFQYQLVGLEDSWIPIANMPFVHFQRMMPGSYTLRVRAILPDGAIMAQSEPLHFIVAPPFWKTKWFVGVVSVLFLILLGSIIFKLKQNINDERLLNLFSVQLYGNHDLSDILWKAAKEMNGLLSVNYTAIYELVAKEKRLQKRSSAEKTDKELSLDMLYPNAISISSDSMNRIQVTDGAHSMLQIGRAISEQVANAAALPFIAAPVWIEEQLFGIVLVLHSPATFTTSRKRKQLQKLSALLAQRIAKFIAEDKLRDKLARDLHDDIGSTLTGINILSKVAGADETTTIKTKEYLKKIQLRSADMMEKMSDIIWAVNPANDALEQVVLKMKEWMAEILEPAGIQYTFHSEEAALANSLPLAVRKDWYFIFKEVITNAVKYSGCTTLKVTVAHSGTTLLMRIEDDGIGFDMNKATMGNGIKNMHSRAAAIGARLNISAAAGRGTVVTLQKDIT